MACAIFDFGICKLNSEENESNLVILVEIDWISKFAIIA